MVQYRNMRSFLHGTATLVGLIIGVGIFGVPYVAAQAGFGVAMFWLVVLGVLSLIIHLFYSEVVSAMPGKHRLAGYTGHFLGKEWKRLVMSMDVLRFWGLQIAYIIVGGTFLWILLGGYFGGSLLVYSTILFAVVALITFFGLDIVKRVEFILAWILLGALMIISAKGIPHINFAHFAGSGSAGFFSPYGVIMVSLAGTAGIPGVWDIVRHKKGVFRMSIIAGTLIAIFITALFAFAVVGVSGAGTSQEAIEGLRGSLGNGIMFFGAFVGLLAVVTSYLVIALYVQEAFEYDFLVKHTFAWLAAIVVPALVFFAGAQNFIQVVDIIGSVLIGGGRILIVALALAVFMRKKAGWWKFKIVLGVLVGLLLAVGVIQELIGLI